MPKDAEVEEGERCKTSDLARKKNTATTLQKSHNSTPKQAAYGDKKKWMIKNAPGQMWKTVFAEVVSGLMNQQRSALRTN